ncbi:MAG TPA: hypothetical protein VGO21_04680, partial [Candidatus Paceibacterota bacterium]|nr:hypothetical protein [Candidatus Paceibacterota bacterium]
MPNQFNDLPKPDKGAASSSKVERLDPGKERLIREVWGKFTSREVNWQIENWLSPEDREAVDEIVRRFLTNIFSKELTYENCIVIDIHSVPIGLPRVWEDVPIRGFRIYPLVIKVKDNNIPDPESNDKGDVGRREASDNIYRSMNESLATCPDDLQLMLTGSGTSMTNEGINIIKIADLPADSRGKSRTVINLNTHAAIVNIGPRGISQSIQISADSQDSFIKFFRKSLSDP